jgi:hypothetical protein
MWGTLHWGSPAGSSTSVPSGMSESSNTWRDELAWWRTALRPAPAACARGLLLEAGARVDLASARQDCAGGRHAEASNPIVEGAPSAWPAAPPIDQGTWRCILAMELCEAGARALAAQRVLLALGGRSTGVRLVRDRTVVLLSSCASMTRGPSPASSVLRGVPCGPQPLRWQCHAGGGRAGTLEQALRRGLLHALDSRRPRLQPLLAIALDVAEALAFLHNARIGMVPARRCAAS